MLQINYFKFFYTFPNIFTTYFNFEKYNNQNRQSESILSFENLPLNSNK